MFSGIRRCCCLLLLLAGCIPARLDPAPAVRLSIPDGLDRHRPVPGHNPLTAAKAALGRRLFFDPVLSADRSLACAGCHIPGLAFTDGKRVGVGVFGRLGRRNVPTLVNRAYGRSFFWDGRTESLEEQVLHPVQDSLEMSLPLGEAVARLRSEAEYAEAFQEVFGAPPDVPTLAAALAGYVRTLLSGGSRFDRWIRGDPGALSAEERAGFALFRGAANCVGCQVPPTFTDEQFHNTGVAWRDGTPADSGRYIVTGRDEDLGAFKTPTLRETARTAPYMHDGSLATLEDVVDFYDRGGHPNRYIDPRIRRLGLSMEQKHALVAFLRALSTDAYETER